MGDLEAGFAHRRQHRGGRRRGGGEEAHEMGQRPLLLGARVEQDRHDDRRAAQVGDAVLGDQVVHRLGATWRRQTWTPALTLIDHGKHQPLQWNIGSVHR